MKTTPLLLLAISLLISTSFSQAVNTSKTSTSCKISNCRVCPSATATTCNSCNYGYVRNLTTKATICHKCYVKKCKTCKVNLRNECTFCNVGYTYKSASKKCEKVDGGAAGVVVIICCCCCCCVCLVVIAGICYMASLSQSTNGRRKTLYNDNNNQGENMQQMGGNMQQNMGQMGGNMQQMGGNMGQKAANVAPPQMRPNPAAMGGMNMGGAPIGNNQFNAPPTMPMAPPPLDMGMGNNPANFNAPPPPPPGF